MCDGMKEEIKALKAKTIHSIFYSVYKAILSYFLMCRKNKDSENPKVVITKTE